MSLNILTGERCSIYIVIDILKKSIYQSDYGVETGRIPATLFKYTSSHETVLQTALWYTVTGMQVE